MVSYTAELSFDSHDLMHDISSPGRHLADAALWLLNSRISTVFSIEKARVETGAEITPSSEFSTGFVRSVLY